jgi:L-arabinose isomerase
MENPLQSENHILKEAIIRKRLPTRPRIGVFGVGYFKYWSQFDGLLDDMLRKQAVFIEKIERNAHAELIDFGLIDTVQKAYELVPKLNAANLDLVFCDMLTYATSNTFGTIIRNLNVPIVLVALQPDHAMDYTRASTYMQLYNDDICSLPEFAGVAARMGKKVPEMIIGTLYDDPQADAEIEEYCRIAAVLHDVRTSRIGHIGHPIEAMLDMHSDSTMFTAHFGAHIVQCEAHEIVTHYQHADLAEIENMKERILDFFDTPEPVSDPISEKLRDSDLEIAARVTVALEKFVETKQLDGLAYYYEGPENSETRTVMSNLIVGNSLLTGAGFPCVANPT